MSESQQLRFIPFDTVVDTAFWHALAKRKLEDYKLMEGPFPITAEFTSGTAPGLTPRINVDLNSIQDPSNISSQCNNCFRVEGSLFTLNTIDQFKELDKQSFINNFGQEHIVPIVAASKKLPEKSNRLLRFLLLTYCLDNLLASYDKWRENSKDVFFSFRVEADGDARVFSLSEFDASQENNYLGFSDPSSDTDHPGWPLRNLLFATSSTLTSSFPETVKVLCFRDRYAHGKRIFSHSFVLRISLLQKPSPSETKFVGWEKWQGKLQPQRVNLSSTMDPIKLAESAVDLNLKLMVWRMLPDLDLATLGKTKCLILGAGTLGCNVAQQLLAWGFRKMTLVDNASVSYSNPVRQTLYTFEDAKAGIKKAEAAAAGLKRIHPCVEVFGVELTIPMPGHAISSISVPTDAALQPQVVAARKACEQLDELIRTHDVVFLLLDTREARWLPTMLATYHSKIAITAALGFDSYLVMRHGLPRSPGTSPSQPSNQETASKAPGDGGLRQLSGSQLGCYFCNDVVGPANIRGFLSQFSEVLPCTRAFPSCSACSQPILDAYSKNGFDFLLRVFDDASYLEVLSGLHQLHLATAFDDVRFFLKIILKIFANIFPLKLRCPPAVHKFPGYP
ncbi:unnamed protein product [Schistocephalus solidus]|uniref:Ubiquitin-like modifier-activating enzyme ATG7 n=1 Tax=Schistocephalus solidus TaxID=70667 RepID=A0A183SUX9_SCHSO|nr:unnamed protein product [Schistocephalus solidus]